MRGRSFSLITCVLIVLAPLVPLDSQACTGDEVPRDTVLDWLKLRILDGLGLEEPPMLELQQPPGVRMEKANHHKGARVSRAAVVDRRRLHQESSQVILFPSSDSTCLHDSELSTEPSTNHYTYYFQPSLNNQESLITSAHFWFYAGEGVALSNSSAPLFILTVHQEQFQVSEVPAKRSPDGWTTYHLEHGVHAVLAEGPFVLQVRCPDCVCHRLEEDKTPFVHLHVRPRSPERRRRAPTVPWSPAAIEKLQRPASGRAGEGAGRDGSDCRREQLEIFFQELGWDNWIVHPKSFVFHYCHGNCSSPERTTSLLGISQCCAPVPESMKSLRFTTTSDGGFSFKYETLPNIIPEECYCI